MTEAAIDFPCSTSTLHLPDATDGSYVDRYANREGDCGSAVEATRYLGLPDHIIKDCPRLMAELHAAGAPDYIKCVAELMLFAEATKD